MDSLDFYEMSNNERVLWQIEQKRLFESMYQIKKDGSDIKKIGEFNITLHPNVFSPLHFPETKWFAKQLSCTIVQSGDSFLEVGVGSGLISLSVSKFSKANVTGVDINQDAVDITKINFHNNNEIPVGGIHKSDLYNIFKSSSSSSLLDVQPNSNKFKYIFWNHPWQQFKNSIINELQSEKTLDNGYVLLRRYIEESKDFLTSDGSLLLGTCNFANINSIKNIANDLDYDIVILRKGEESLNQLNNVKEIYYILKFVKKDQNSNVNQF
ncbi:hypothetical protein ACTFIU_002234 [Dictyostelium citrinum]